MNPYIHISIYDIYIYIYDHNRITPAMTIPGSSPLRRWGGQGDWRCGEAAQGPALLSAGGEELVKHSW
jgi:hypothetical protein